MVKSSIGEGRQVKCPEEQRIANIYPDWHERRDRPVLNSICCDDPRLRNIDDWECGWSCWEQIAGEEVP